MRDSRPKSSYLVEAAVTWIVIRSPGSVFATFTFAENVTDLREAKRRWRPVADYLRREGIVAAGGWERQQRGAWHCHVVLSKRVDVVRLREFAIKRGWGTFINLRRVSQHDPRSEDFKRDVERTAKYIAAYLTKDNSGADWGASLTLYVGKGARVGNVRFHWVGGLSAVFRAGCSFYCELHDHKLPDFGKPGMFDYIMQLGLEQVLGDPRFSDVPRARCYWGKTLPPPPDGQPF